MTDTQRTTRKICGLLLETYFQIEKTRDLILSQLIVILARTSLQKLNNGYLFLQSDRKKVIGEFVETYLIDEGEAEDNPIFCPLFGNVLDLYDGPWMSGISKQSVVDYITFVKSNAAPILANNCDDFGYRMFGCSDIDDCRVTLQYQSKYDESLVLGLYNSWKVSFVTPTEVTFENSQYSSYLRGTFKISRNRFRAYTIQSTGNGRYMEVNMNTGALMYKAVPQGSFKVEFIGKY